MQIGDTVQIIDAGSSYYKQLATIVYISDGQYCIKMDDGYLEIMFERDFKVVNPCK